MDSWEELMVVSESASIVLLFIYCFSMEDVREWGLGSHRVSDIEDVESHKSTLRVHKNQKCFKGGKKAFLFLSFFLFLDKKACASHFLLRNNWAPLMLSRAVRK
jgi:hypothetical protein